jgi:hypothetical protein
MLRNNYALVLTLILALLFVQACSLFNIISGTGENLTPLGEFANTQETPQISEILPTSS